MDQETDLPTSLHAALVTAVDRLESSVVAVHGRRGYPLSGVAWGDDLVATTHRAVGRDERLAVSLADGERRSAELVGRDPSSDLALLRLDEPLPAAATVPALQLRVGQPVLRLARPSGALRASFGIVSAIEGRWRSSLGAALDAFVLSDARAYRGFSGGPLVTLEGAVAGLTSRAHHDLPITIPSETVDRIAALLLEHGHVPRGYLGLSGQPLRLPAALQPAAGGSSGLLITSVEEGGPAAEAGLTLGDTLLSLAGEPVAHPGAVAALLGPDTPGSDVELAYLRGGQRLTAQITVGERPRRRG